MTIEPPDLTGFELSMATMIEGGAADEVEARRMRAMLCDFVGWARGLDQWKLKSTRAQMFAPGEPVMHGPAPCVVLSVSPVRVVVRKWHQPVIQSGFPMAGEVRWLGPANIRKVSSRDRWETWRRLMAFAGHNPEHWTTSDFVAALTESGDG